MEFVGSVVGSGGGGVRMGDDDRGRRTCEAAYSFAGDGFGYIQIHESDARFRRDHEW